MSIQYRWIHFDDIIYNEVCSSSSDENAWKIMLDNSEIRSLSDNDQAMIVFEYIYHNVLFCKQSNLNFEQARAYLFVIIKIFDQYVFMDKEGSCTAEFISQMFVQEFRDVIDAERSKYVDQIKQDKESEFFPIEKVKLCTAYFSRTLLRNLLAYQYACHEPQDEILSTELIQIQQPMIPMPLHMNNSSVANVIDSNHESNAPQNV